MTKTFTKLFIPLLFVSGMVNGQFTEIVPASHAGTTTGSFIGPYNSGARSYQLLMDASLLTNMVGSNIEGLTFRTASTTTTTWPASTTTFPNYDVYIAPAVPIASATNIFASNEAAPATQVRSGSFVVAAGSFPAGGATSWGQVTTFQTPYHYTGGNLAVLIRHDGSDGVNRSVNALATSTTGYGTLFKACWLAGYTSIGGSQGNFGIVQFTYNTPLAVNLVKFEAYSRGNDVNLSWATASEKNSKRFVIERSTNGSSYEAIHVVAIGGNSESGNEYEYNDAAPLADHSVLYYRLKVEDNDGTYKYSKVVKLARGKVQAGNLALSPNPVQSVSNLSFTLSATTAVSYRVLDISGKVVLQEKFEGRKGQNGLLTDFSMLPSGSYVLQMQCAEFNDVVRFVKQ